MPTWQDLVDIACRTIANPDDTSIALCRISADGLSELAACCQGMLTAWRSVSDVHGATSDALGLMQLTVMLDRLDPGEPSCTAAMLGVAHLLTAAPAGVLVQGLGVGGEAVGALVRLHTRAKDLASATSQLVVSSLFACARACESHGRPPACVLPPSSLRGVADVLISHIVYLAVTSEGGGVGITGGAKPKGCPLMSQRGLCCADRALRMLAALARGGPSQGGPKGEEAERMRREVALLCSAADVGGRALQLVSQSDLEAALPQPWAPEGAAKGESVGELYVKLLSAAVTYVSAATGAFSAPNGRLLLTAESLQPVRTWLLGRGRLAALAYPLETLAEVVHHNALLGHVECPEIRDADTALRNLLLTLALPLCTSKRHADIVEVVEFSMRYFQALKAAGYERVLQLAAGAEPVALPEVATSMPTPLPADPDSMYTAGEIQPFFSAVAGVLLHGVRTIGGQLEAWGVQLVQAPLSPTPGSDPSQFLFGLEVIFPEELTATGTSSAGAAAASSAADGEVTSSRHRGGSGSGQDEHAGESEGHSGGVPASKAEQFIRDQLAPIVVMSDLLLHAVQKSQESLMYGRGPLQYRKATVRLPNSSSSDAGAPAPGSGGGTASSDQPHQHVSARRCANCGAHAQEPGTRLKACQKCGVALYCSRDCQLQHWASVHKLQCQLLLQPGAPVKGTVSVGL